MTLSIVARSADARLFGIAIASSSPAVAARCAHARAGAGAVATQNITDPALGPLILGGMARAESAADALAAALRATPFGAYRQLLVIGLEGSAGRAFGRASARHREFRPGRRLPRPRATCSRMREVPAAMVEAFEGASGHFGWRLLEALRAGVSCGGEAGPLHSAGLLVVREVPWPLVDLRVDWKEEDPVSQLGRTWEIYAPQIEDYVLRALSPGRAPSFGVPGDR